MKPHVPIKALLLDDEPDACRNLNSILSNYWKDTIEVAGYAFNTTTAEQLITQHVPDVLFIDIEMPGENAFQFLQRIAPLSFEVIFVTAYDDYALKALKLNAVDYILKPISLEELEEAISKLCVKLERKHGKERPEPGTNYSELGEQVLNDVHADKVVLKSRNEVFVVQFKDISYIKAEGSYAHFYFTDHKQSKSVMMSYPLVDYEELLPADIFFRTHKSYLINCRYIDHINRGEQCSVSLKDGTVLPLSRRRAPSLMNFLEQYRLA
ncbi:MAG TPA: LytTR family DNA-binding domain-containing protein [Chitinophagaceae bacterium]|nr:LytTR family DNA-binding domain-containing protein [Chitinophagaceae bacterium]